MAFDLDKYKPGQLITSVTRRAFLDLWEEIQLGTIQERWPEGKVAQTRKERTEDMRVRALVMIFEDHPSIFKKLLANEWKWRRIEVYMGEDGLIHSRVLKDQTQELEAAKVACRWANVTKRR